MAVRKHKGSWWVDYTFRDPAGQRKRYRLRSPGYDRSSALEYEHMLRQRLVDGKQVLLSKELGQYNLATPKLDAFAASWFATCALPRLKPSTYASYLKRYRRYLRPHLGLLRLDAISALAVDRLTARLVNEGLHSKTINNALCVLRRMLTSATEWGQLEHVPRIKWLKAPPATFDFLSPIEADQLVRHAEREPWKSMLATALHTGLRVGELVALRWSDVDLERRQLCVRRTAMLGVETSPKNNRIRFVPLTLELHAVLVPRAKPDGHVFLNHGSSVTHSAAGHALRRICAKASIRPVGWHVLRHTFASHLVSENVPLLAVQAFLGHSDIKMTQRYAHIAPSMLRGFIESIVTARIRALDDSRHPEVTPREREANTMPLVVASPYESSPI